MTILNDWAAKECQVRARLSREAGMTPARAFHDGVEAALLVVLGEKLAATSVAGLVLSSGARGSRCLAGLRHGFAMVEGVRSYIRAQESTNADAWACATEDG